MKALSINVLRKEVPNEAVLGDEFKMMPIEKDGPWKKVGYGDWGRGRSQYGSVVLGDGDYVVKMHVGKICNDDRSPMEWATQKRKATEIFSQVSPLTMVMVVDGVDGPRPAILQKEINGKPIYKASFRGEILQPEVLQSLADIMSLTRKGLEDGYALDISGLRLRTGGVVLEKLVKMCPIFSDNIMIDQQKKVWLVDNVPDYYKDKKRGVWFKFKRAVEGVCLSLWEGVFLGTKAFLSIKI